MARDMVPFTSLAEFVGVPARKMARLQFACVPYQCSQPLPLTSYSTMVLVLVCKVTGVGSRRARTPSHTPLFGVAQLSTVVLERMNKHAHIHLHFPGCFLKTRELTRKMWYRFAQNRDTLRRPALRFAISLYLNTRVRHLIAPLVFGGSLLASLGLRHAHIVYHRAHAYC